MRTGFDVSQDGNLGAGVSPPKLGGVSATSSSLEWSRRGGSLYRHVSECILKNFEWGTTPSVRAEVANASFLDCTATPPNLGGTRLIAACSHSVGKSYVHH